MKLTRREWAGALAAAGILDAQAPPAALSPAAEDPLRAAIEETARDSAAVAKLHVPMDTEPAFIFHAY